jgi:hypothetical protein
LFQSAADFLNRWALIRSAEAPLKIGKDYGTCINGSGKAYNEALIDQV